MTSLYAFIAGVLATPIAAFLYIQAKLPLPPQP